MKDVFFGIAMLLAAIFCALAGAQFTVMFYVGGVFVAIGVVVMFMAEFGGGIVKNAEDEKELQ